MYVLITYDVATSSPSGQRRLRRVAKICLDYGQRVQYSVFECDLEPAQLARLRFRLGEELDISQDSLRIYNLGKNWRARVEHIGVKRPYDVDGPLVV